MQQFFDVPGSDALGALSDGVPVHETLVCGAAPAMRSVAAQLEPNIRGEKPMGDSERHGKAQSQRGWYLLEYAVILFGAAVFIVGFSDISRIFHARGAVRAGVTEGLRCLYPTDAGCSDQTLANGWFPNDRFTARVSGGDLSNLYELPRVSFGLSSAWFNEPVSEAGFATKQLTAATLTQSFDAYRQYQVLFPGTAHAVYVLKTQELPTVAAGASDNANLRVLEPRFVDPESSTGAARDPNLTLEAPRLRLNAATTGAGNLVDVTRVTFTISMSDVLTGVGGTNALSWESLKAQEAAYGFTAACYEGARVPFVGGTQGIQWPPSGSPRPCSYPGGKGDIYTGSDLYVPIMVHIAGNASITGTRFTGVQGAVEIEMSQAGTTRSLGGRSFRRGALDGPNQWGNFVVRGAGSMNGENFNAGSRYIDACSEAGYTECFQPSYVRLPLVKVGVPVTLTFGIKWNRLSGSTRPPVQVAWNGGDIRVFFPRFQATHEQKSCGYSSSPNACGTSVAPMQVSYRTTNLDQAFSHSSRPETSCARTNPSGYQPSIPSALEGFRSEIRTGKRPLQPISFWSGGLTSDRCSPKVSQVSCTETAREYMKGCEPQYRIPEDVVAKCQLPDYKPERDTISNPRYSYGLSAKTEARGGCTGEAFPECAKPYLQTKPAAFLGAVSNGCAVAQPVNTAPEKIGPMFLNTCIDPLPGFIDEYRKKHGVPPSVGIPGYTREEEPVITTKKPTNGCWKTNPIAKDSRRSWVCAERSSYAAANNCCKTYAAQNCSIERIAMGDGGGEAGDNNQIISAARQRAFDTVQAAYPPARMDAACGADEEGIPAERDCIAIQAGPAENGTQARIQAAMQVPLALFDWFGLEKTAVVQYEESRVLESSLVGEAS